MALIFLFALHFFNIFATINIVHSSEGENMKKGKILIIIYVLTFLFVLVGSTFSYFTMSKDSGEGAITSSATTLTLNLEITPIHDYKPLIPMNDEDVEKAYYHSCNDDNNFGACQAYKLTIKDSNIDTELSGTIKFSLTDIENLKYTVIEVDEDTDEITPYLDEKMTVIPDTSQTLGSSFLLSKGEERSFVIIIWIPNFEEDQNEYDGGGSFTAEVTYESTSEYRLTGSISSN